MLFGTNVAAIIATGVAVLLLYRVREAAAGSGRPVGRLTGRTLVVVGAFVVVMAVPLTYGSLQMIEEQNVLARARPVAAQWAGGAGWEVTGLTFAQHTLSVTATGLPPEPRDTELRQALDGAGLGDVDLQVDSVIGGTSELPGDG